MRNLARLSTLALCIAMASTLPAAAVSLNLNTHLLLGNTGSGSASSNTTQGILAVHTDNLLNDGDNDGKAVIDVGTDGILGTGDDTAIVNLDLFGTGKTSKAVVSVGTDGVLGTDDDTGSVLVNLFGGDSGNQTSADLNLGGIGGGSGDADAKLLVDLFGGGDDTTAALDLGDSGTGLGDLGILGDGTSGNLLLDLFGPASGNSGGSGSGGGGGSNGGGTADNGGNGGGSSGGSGNGGGGTGAIPPGTTEVQVASIGEDFSCFTPNDDQIATLINRHSYAPATMSGWSAAANVQVVEVGLCPAAQDRLASIAAADANLGLLRAYIGGDPAISSRIGAEGHAIGDVIAMDKKGETLVVYVI